MRIGLVCSGGDCAGMNPATKKFVEYALELGHEPYFIREGLEGLIEGKIEPATPKEVSGILHKGGTILQSSRSKRFFDPAFRLQAYQNLQHHSIEALVILGGDGSFRAMEVLAKEHSLLYAGIPATIDNDIRASDYALGVDSALNVILESTDRLRDTAESFRRAFVVEVMGRDCGYLALASAIACGAEVCIIPEMGYSLQSLGERLKEELGTGKRRYVLAIVSEGAKASSEVVSWLKEEVGIETRITILGHVQRGGSPSVYDRLMGFRFMQKALDSLSLGKSGVVVLREGRVEFLSSQEASFAPASLPLDMVRLASRLMF